jgi:hypothetical protein
VNGLLFSILHDDGENRVILRNKSVEAIVTSRQIGSKKQQIGILKNQ